MNGLKLYRVFNDADSMAEFVGEVWKDLQKNSIGLFFVSSPLSSTPLPLYQWVIDHAASFENWSNFKFILMDEQIEKGEYVPINDAASYERFARINFIDGLQKKTGIKDPLIKPSLKDFDGFDKEIEKGIDLLIIAIGAKGHYAQVMPGTGAKTGFHTAQLIPELATMHTQKGSKSYEGAEFRDVGMSLGPAQVLSAKNIIMMITGSSKKKLAEELLSFHSFDPEFPASILFHPLVKAKACLLVTKDAL